MLAKFNFKRFQTCLVFATQGFLTQPSYVLKLNIQWNLNTGIVWISNGGKCIHGPVFECHLNTKQTLQLDY